MRTRDRRPISEIIAALEADALALHRSGQPTRSFWLKHWRQLGRVTKEGPATYAATVQRLTHLLASGDDSDQEQRLTAIRRLARGPRLEAIRRLAGVDDQGHEAGVVLPVADVTFTTGQTPEVQTP
jgi:hypothetical protein